jgi:hypothetical protein
MAVANQTLGTYLKENYAFSENVASNQFTTTMEHTFYADCPYLFSIKPFYLTYALVFLFSSILWYVFGWKVYKYETLPIQKFMIIVPILKSLNLFLGFGYFDICPWTSDGIVRYILMAMISISTLYESLFLSVILLMSKVKTDISILGLVFCNIWTD